MGKKKASANAFFYFMQELKQRQGRHFRNMKDVAEEAGKHWQNMTPEQKRPYEEIAKKDRNNGSKYTSINENIDDVLKKDASKLERENKMRNDIKMTVSRNLDLGRLADTHFYLIHIQEYYYKDERVYPAEIAVLRFNLNYGILDSNIYHMLVKPGPFPLGSASEVKAISEDTHQLPPPFGDECNMDQIIADLLQFIKVDYNAADSSFPPLYAHEKNFRIVDETLTGLCEDYGYVRDHFQLHTIEYLLFYLRNRESQVWASVANAVIEIGKDLYYFTEGIGCEIHEMSDTNYSCCRAYIIRAAFTICDVVCPEMGIMLIPGQHVPANTKNTVSKVQTMNSRPGSVASEARCYDYDGEDDYRTQGGKADAASLCSGYTRDKTTYSVASSVDFGDYDTEDTISQSTAGAWKEVSGRHSKRRGQSQWQTQATQETTRFSLLRDGGINSQATLELSQATQKSSQEAGASGVSQSGSKYTSQNMRRPTTMSVAQQFKNISLPSSGVGTVGSSAGSVNGSITKGRGRASIIYDNN